MTPNFALSLSFEGIRLLHRVTGGWHLVGEVALDNPDLKGALAALKADALRLEPGGLRTKLLIPPEQIKFTTIETARTTLEDVHAALDGETPYGIDELVIDFDRNGGRTHIAAVARETLDEAQAFAAEHGFDPVAFVAIAEPFTFQNEVFFGPVAGLHPAKTPTRDNVPVKVIGTADLPKATEAREAEDKPQAVDEAQAEEETPLAEDVPEPVPDPEPAPEPEPAAEKTPEPEPEPEADPAPEVVFASRSRSKSLPPQEMPTPVTTPTPAPVAVITAEADPEPQIEPLFTRRKETPPLAVPTATTGGPSVASPVLDLPGAPPKPIIADAPEAAEAPALTGKPQNAAKTDASFAPIQPVKDTAPDVAPATKAVAATDKPGKAKATAFDAAEPVRGKPRFFALKLTAGLLVFLFLIALWANSWSEDGLAWLWGGDETPEIVEAPAEVVPAPETLPVIALDEPQETPAPSALAPVDDAPVEAAEAPPLPVVRAPTGRVLSPAEADRIYAATGVYQRAPRLPLEPREQTLDGFRESAIVSASPRPDQLRLPGTDALFQDVPIAAPRNPPAPGTVYQRDLRGFILATADGVLTPDGALVFAGEPLRIPPLRPGTEVIPAPDPSPVAANGEGMILIAGRPPVVPPLRPEGLVPEAVEAEAEPTQEAPAPVETVVAEQETTAPDTAAAVEAPEGLVLVAGRPPVVPPLRPDGLAPDEAAAPAQTDTPAQEGLIVVAGAPSSRPPLRPASFADLSPVDEAAIAAQVTEVVSTAGGVSLAGLRPSVRPATAIPAPVFADPALAGLRPSLRPAGLAPPPEPATPDITDIVAAIADAAPEDAPAVVTAQAVAVSMRPDTRPRNFARVVAAAQQRIARSQSAPAATVASAPTQAVRNTAVAPTGPTTTTVARAATANNAIRLRDVNLIGVYGRPGDRRALVRMGNGRYVKVEVGSSLDGGRVTAIGDSALNYVKRGRTYALQLPQS